MKTLTKQALCAFLLCMTLPSMAQEAEIPTKDPIKRPANAPLPIISAEDSIASHQTTMIIDQKAHARLNIPKYKADPFWPKPLPNNWTIGQVPGVAVDKQNRIWIIHRSDTLSQRELGAEQNPRWSKCCYAAPPVLVFDQEGNLLKAWGGMGEGYDWPDKEHSIHVDDDGYVWIAGNGKKDSHILKFTEDGQFVMQIGKPNQSNGNTDTKNLSRPAYVEVDTKAKEVYVADGYRNRRVIVFDSHTGDYKRHWGAYGKTPFDGEIEPFDRTKVTSPHFASPVHCVHLSVDNLVYVCDRRNNRYQIFKKDGTFVREAFFERNTLHSGSVSDIVFSRDPQQKFVFMVDGVNRELRIIERATDKVIARLGRPGRQAGEFHVLHNVAVDHQGNLYTTEVDTGQRIQRFHLIK